MAASFPTQVRDAFAVLSAAQDAVGRARQVHGALPSAAYQRRVSALKAAQTKASKRFARACFAFGFDDAQAVVDELSKEQEQALRSAILSEVERLQAAAKEGK